MTKNIIIPVNLETANIFNNLPLKKRDKIQNFLSLQLEIALKSKQSLPEIMDEISEEAKEKGLTPEIL
jgi:RNA recognition motif-containing protein